MDFSFFKEGKLPYILIEDVLPFPEEEYERMVKSWWPETTRDARSWEIISNLRGPQELTSSRY